MPAQAIDALFVLSLWAVAIAVATQICLPTLLHLLGFFIYYNWAEPDVPDDSVRQDDRHANGLMAFTMSGLLALTIWAAISIAIVKFVGTENSLLFSSLQVLCPLAAVAAGWWFHWTARATLWPPVDRVADDDPDFGDVGAQLQALGFRPVGTMRDSFWFFVMHWVKGFSFRCYGSQEHQAFVCVYRFVPREPVRVALATCFSDGAMIWTGNHMDGDEYEAVRDGYFRWGFVTNNLAQLLRMHKEAVGRFQKEGRVALAHNELSTLLPIYAQHTHLLASARRAPLEHFVLSLGLLAGGYFVASWQFGHGHWAIPLGIIAGGLAKVQFDKILFDSMAKHRQQEVNRGGPTLADVPQAAADE